MKVNIQFLNKNKILTLFGLAITSINLALMNFFRVNLNEGISFFNRLLTDLSMIGLALYFGSKHAFNNDLVVWYDKKKLMYIKHYIVLIVLALGIIVPNTINGYRYSNLPVDAHWFYFSNFSEPLFLSLRAAIQEELVFRLLLIPLIVSYSSRIVKTKTNAALLGVILSSIAFGIIHPGFYFAFYCGLLLGYTYYKYGIVPAFIIHFLADVIPFTMLYVVQHRGL